jgi:hypothetical protein
MFSLKTAISGITISGLLAVQGSAIGAALSPSCPAFSFNQEQILAVQSVPATSNQVAAPTFDVAARVVRKGRTSVTLTAPPSVKRRLNSMGTNIFFLYQRQPTGWAKIGFAPKPSQGCKAIWLTMGAETNAAYNSADPIFPGDKTPWRAAIEIPNLPTGHYAVSTNVEIVGDPSAEAGGFFKV